MIALLPSRIYPRGIDPPGAAVKIPAVIFRASLLVLALLASGFARAQDAADGPAKMTPEYCFTFPVTMLNQHDVTVKYPVMINPVTVLKPGMVLRVIYMPPVQNDSNDLIAAHKGTMEESYTRQTANTDAHQASLPPEMQQEIDRQRKRVWEVPNNFILAIAQYPTDVMHLIYSPTGGDRDSELVDTSFSFFDGMFIGSPNGGVQVLAVEKGSYADRAGVKAGDEITAVGDVPMRGDLSSFAATFSAVKRAATDNQLTSFSITIRSAGRAPHQVALAEPPSIKSFLNEGL
jgi:hypothetical protein